MFTLIPVPRKPKSYLDAIKIVAIFMVIFNHTDSFYAHMELLSQPLHWLTMGHSMIIGTAVPLFFMCSGATLLGREEPMDRLFLHRVLRFVVILALVSILIYVENNGTDNLDLRDFFMRLYRNGVSYHLWYMYSYISFLIMLPLLRKIARGMNTGIMLLLVASAVLTETLPIVDYFIFHGENSHTSHFYLLASCNYLLFPMCGYYLDNVLPKEKLSVDALFVLFMGTLFSIWISCLLMDARSRLEGGWSTANMGTYINTFTLFPAIFLFCAFKRLFVDRKLPSFLVKLLSILSSCTFGVYLFEGIFRRHTRFVYEALYEKTGAYAANWIHALCSLIAGLACVFLWKCLTGLIRAAVLKAFPGRK